MKNNGGDDSRLSLEANIWLIMLHINFSFSLDFVGSLFFFLSKTQTLNSEPMFR